MIRTTLRTTDNQQVLEIDGVTLLEGAPDVELLALIQQQFVYTCSAEEVAGLEHDHTLRIGQLLHHAKAARCGLSATFAAQDVLAWLRVHHPDLAPLDAHAVHAS
ncbi:hypothetical protein [Deinococcus ruber]|uniref:Uncharacterized protein n=1 Tax=Deinococcus ruber TaxID=1848197 RepID=A0A918CDQ2_9DEIO|nr:hypothetical protein [Deinococcus ruber]GGR17414.1 hypothetical protein GCM10008957_32620 [Deinococcus ruber]